MTSLLPQEVTGGQRRFYRAIRLERDLAEPGALDGYLLTPQVKQVARRLEAGLRDGATERAWTLTGPYGSGKSTFALFLAQLLSAADRSSPAWTLLKHQDLALAEHLALTLDGRGLLPVAVTLRRAPLALTVLEALRQAAGTLPRLNGVGVLLDDLAADLVRPQPDSRAVVRRVEALRDLVVEHGPYKGILIALDELGKGLEYAARHAGEDVFLLQELAEVASRSHDRPLVIIGILHQAFEQYGERLDLTARKEWAKVQGRFSDIAFLEPPEQQMRLASAAVAALALPGAAAWGGRLATIAESVVAAGHGPSGLKAEEFNALAANAYPLHPSLLIALPHLFRRLAQNERSLFAYLQSQEPFGLQELVRERPDGLMRLPDLFDYVAANLGGSLARQTATRRWLEAVDATERAPSLPPLETALLKTIGVLGILGETPAVQPTSPLLALALADQPDDPAVQTALATLQSRSLVVFRRYSRVYRIWEGSDVDVEARIEEGQRKTAGQPGMADHLGRFLAHRPLVARRHSHTTGALRAFEVRYLDEPARAEHLAPARLDGLIVCCLPAGASQVQRFLEWAASPPIAALPHLLVVVPDQIGPLREAIDELRALHWAWENTPELRDDRVARRELAERIAHVEQALAQLTTALLDPRLAPLGAAAGWLYRGEAQAARTPVDVTQLLSQAMDALYPESPRVRNELINRRTLSSAAAAARRTLIERMLTDGNRPLLGLEGFPPERSMYASVLQASGLHREEDGQWGFGPPPPADRQGLRPVWEAMERIIFGATQAPCPVSDLFAQLAAPPYGALPGVLPVLLAAFLLARADEISLYREGSFVPDPGIADFEVLMRRPELFAVAGSQVSGERAAVVTRLASGLGTRPATLPVVRGLLRRVRALPEYAWRTRRLPPEVLALRAAIERARSPERLLFEELPAALGEPPFAAATEPDTERIGRFFDRLNGALATWQAAFPAMVESAHDTLLAVCGQPAGEAGWIMLRQQARRLGADALHPGLAPFVRRLSDPGEPSTIVDSVLALVAGRPPRGWTDADVDRFPAQAAELGERFRHATNRLGVLTAEEETQAQALVARLRVQAGTDTSPRLLRAALTRLLTELDETEEVNER